MLRKRVFTIAFIVVCIGLIISLIFNNVYSTRLNREHRYIHLLYNHLMIDVYMAAPPHTDFPGRERASLNMAYAASVLQDLSQASMVDNGMGNTELIQEDAGFASYIAFALVGQNTQYLTGSGNKDVITITPNQAKNIVIKMRQIIMKTVVNGSDIPDEKIDAVYNGIHNLIPANFKTLNVVFDHVSQ